MSNNIDKVRVIVVGDSGAGKTSLVHLIAHHESLWRPGWTVGCNIEVCLHEWREGTAQQKPYFIELFDIGGSISHKNTRSVFYTHANGIILVHDLTNRKSHENLREWLYDILNKDNKDPPYKANSSGLSSLNSTLIGGTQHQENNNSSFDAEQLLGTIHIPVLVVGTKLDCIDEKRQPKSLQRTGSIAELCVAEEVWLNCQDVRCLRAGTTDAVKLARFFDRVIEKNVQTRESSGPLYGSSNADRRKYVNPMNFGKYDVVCTDDTN